MMSSRSHTVDYTDYRMDNAHSSADHTLTKSSMKYEIVLTRFRTGVENSRIIFVVFISGNTTNAKKFTSSPRKKIDGIARRVNELSESRADDNTLHFIVPRVFLPHEKKKTVCDSPSPPQSARDYTEMILFLVC